MDKNLLKHKVLMDLYYHNPIEVTNRCIRKRLNVAEGSVCLNIGHLRDDGLIKIKPEGRVNTYIITAKGLKLVKELL